MTNNLPPRCAADTHDINRPALQVHGVLRTAYALVFCGAAVGAGKHKRKPASVAKPHQFFEEHRGHVVKRGLEVASELGWLEVWRNYFGVTHGYCF